MRSGSVPTLAALLQAPEQRPKAFIRGLDVPDPAGGPDVEEPVQGASRSRRSLASQIEAALSRLTVLRGSDQAGSTIGPALDAAVRALDALQPEAARARG